MVQVSPKLIVVSELVVGRTENQPSKEYILYPRKYFTSTQNELFRSLHGLFNSVISFLHSCPTLLCLIMPTPSRGLSISSAWEKA